MNRRAATRGAFVALQVASGFAILTTETLWARCLGHRLGSTLSASTVVVTAFFGFAAIGSAIAGRVASSASPLACVRAHAACEIGAALTNVVGYALLRHTSVLGSFASEALRAALLIALPCGFAGAGLPLLAGAFVRDGDERTSRLGPLYAANLVGSAAGALLGGVSIPAAIGERATLAIAAGVGGFIASSAAALSPGFSPARPTVVAHQRDPPRGAIAIVALGGAAALATQVLLLAHLRQLLVDSVVLFGATLFAFFVTTALGAAAVARARQRGRRASELIVGAMVASAIGVAIAPAGCALAQSRGWAHAFGGGIAWQLALVTLLTLPAGAPVGAVFPLSWELVTPHASGQARPIGAATLANKLGAAVGAAVVPFTLIPAIGLGRAFGVVAAAYATLALVLRRRQPRRRRRTAPLVFAAVAIVASFAYQSDAILLHPGERLVRTYRSRGDLVAVVDDAEGSRHIVVNGGYVLNGTGRALLPQRMQGWLPLVLADAADDVLFIGMASGITAAAALDAPVRRLDAVELLPDVARAARDAFTSWNARLFADPRAHVVIDDGRAWLGRSERAFDVIACDLMLPQPPGTAALYSVEFTRRVAAHLKDGGVYALWLPMHQLDGELFSIVERTVLTVFPYVALVRAGFSPLEPAVAFVAASRPIDVSRAHLDRRLRATSLTGATPLLATADGVRTLIVGDGRDDAAMAPPALVTSDDRPSFAFAAAIPVTPGRSLRGMSLLARFAPRAGHVSLPSLACPDGERDELVAAIRAGHHLYAAAVSALPLPVDEATRARRAHEAAEHVATARRLAPTSLDLDALP